MYHSTLITVSKIRM